MTEELCPKCGAVLNGFVITTIPPIHGVSCPSCGWRYEEPQKITYSVYQERKSQTNYDLIISKTPEELAEYIDLHTAEAMWCESPPKDCPPHEECVKCILEWLRSPVKEGEG